MQEEDENNPALERTATLPAWQARTCDVVVVETGGDCFTRLPESNL